MKIRLLILIVMYSYAILTDNRAIMIGLTLGLFIGVISCLTLIIGVIACSERVDIPVVTTPPDYYTEGDIRDLIEQYRIEWYNRSMDRHMFGDDYNG